MKRWISALLVCVMIAGLCACGSTSSASPAPAADAAASPAASAETEAAPETTPEPTPEPLSGAKALIAEADALLAADIRSEENTQKALALFQQAADEGELDALCSIGDVYGYGMGIEKDVDKAKTYYQQAIDAGSAYACERMAALCRASEGWESSLGWENALPYYKMAAERGLESSYFFVALAMESIIGPKDYQEIRSWYEKARDAGDDRAWYELGSMDAYGASGTFPIDYAAAMEEFQKGAEAENGNSMNCAVELAEMYRKGLGTEVDYDKALAWYEKGLALVKNYVHIYLPKGLLDLGMHWMNGDGVQKDMDKARRAFELAVQAGSEEAAAVLSTLESYVPQDNAAADVFLQAEELFYTGKFEEAVALMRENLDSGYAPLQELLGLACYMGYGTAEDNDEAYRLFCLAADQGNPSALYCKARNLEFGYGVAADKAAADEMYRQAIAAMETAVGLETDPRTQGRMYNFLGFGYMYGQTGKTDGEKALKYFTRAVELGDTLAARQLGALYATGGGGIISVPRDYEKALECMELAAAGNIPGAAESAAEIRGKLGS